MSDKFNQKEYQQAYNKEHYKAFKVDLKKRELEELEDLLKQKELSKAQFLRDAMAQLKNQSK